MEWQVAMCLIKNLGWRRAEVARPEMTAKSVRKTVSEDSWLTEHGQTCKSVAAKGQELSPYISNLRRGT